MMKNFNKIILGISLIPSILYAQAPTKKVQIPGAADAGRILTTEKIIPSSKPGIDVSVPEVNHHNPVPESAKTITFELKDIHIENMTVFTLDQISDTYEEFLNKKISLSTVWSIVDKITQRYRKDGYFLSRAYIPQQKISQGHVIIKIVEGYIGEVELPEDVKKHAVVRSYIDNLILEKPATSKKLESFLLKMNDIPGYSFRSVLSPMDKNNNGAVKLTLIPSKTKGRGMISYDNFSSRYSGRDEATSYYTTSLLPLNQTTIAGVISSPIDRLNYVNLNHKILVAPNTILDLNASTTKSYPGYSLEPYRLDSEATSFGVGINYQFIRQREENLMTKFSVTSTNVTTNSLGYPLTRDHVRAFRAGFSYNINDRWLGSNLADFTLSQGINGFNSSNNNDPYLSRANAKPNFTKAALTLSRLQGINKDWSLFASGSGQMASNSLYSSEQFGYGGQSFGRAYDSSEIVGDRGVSGSLELRYENLDELLSNKFINYAKFQPYGFYDIGSVKDKGYGAVKESGASAGLGLRFSTKWNQAGNIGLAWPLTRKVSTPIYNNNHTSPRIMLQVSQEF